jgi:tellurite resistance protein TerB
MSLFGKLFKTGAKAAEAVKKFENKDLVEATVAAALLIAAADGKIEDEEVLKLQEIIEAMPSMQNFQSEIGVLTDKYSKLLKAGFMLGKIQLMREIRECKHSDNEAEDIIVVALTIASADGEMEPEEIAVLKDICKALGVAPSQFGIQ